MNQLIQLIYAHPTAFVLGAYWVFSAIVSGMPEPAATSGMGYVWAYRSLHTLSGDLSSAVASKFPPAPQVKP